MKALRLLSMIALAGLGVAYGQAVKDPRLPNPVRTSTRIQVVASMESASVKIGDPTRVIYHFKNVSSESVTVQTGSQETDCWFIVTDASGTEVPRTALGDKVIGGIYPAGHVIAHGSISGPLPPGEECCGSSAELTELYRLDRPGKYFVRMAYRSLAPESSKPVPMTQDERNKNPREEAVSDLIPFTVTP